MKKKILILSVVVATVLFTGCGGGGSSSTATTYQNINGLVSDPVISNAEVRLCEKENITICTGSPTLSKDDGTYTLSVDDSLDFSQYVMIAKNGTDTKTGVSFSGITLRTPANLTKNANNELVISPLTTLVAEKNKTLNLEAALTEVASNLGITKDSLHRDPTLSKDAQEAAILITTFRKEGETAFEDISISNGDFNTFIQSNYSSDVAKLNKIDAILKVIGNNNTSSETIIRTFSILKQLINSDKMDTLDKTNQTIYDNLRKIVTKISEQLESIDNPNLAQIKYIVGLTDSNDLTDDTLVVADIDLEGVDLNDIKEIDVNLTDVSIALSSPLGNDSDKKRAYYYSSNISHLNKAELIISNITDVATTDSIYLDIVKGYANNNEITKAEAYADSFVYKSVNKAAAYLYIAEKLIEKDADTTKIKNHLDTAYSLYKKVYASKLMDSALGKALNHLYVAYVKQDLLTEATTIIAYIDGTEAQGEVEAVSGKIEEFTEQKHMTSFLNGLEDAAEYQIEKNDFQNAKNTIDDLFRYAKQILPYTNKNKENKSKWHRQVEVIYLRKAAVLYLNIDNNKKAIEVLDYIQAQRKNDGISENGEEGASTDTASKTNSYVKFYVKNYIQAGDITKAKEAIESIVNYTKTSYYDASYKEYAFGIYKDAKEEAYKIIDENISSYIEKIYTLSYFGVTEEKLTPFIAWDALLNDNDSLALEATKKAEDILDDAVSLSSESEIKKQVLNYVHYGYAKLAHIYNKINETSKSEQSFSKALKIIDDITVDTTETNFQKSTDPLNLEYKARGYIYIENKYFIINNNEEAVKMQKKAIEFTDTITHTITKAYIYNILLGISNYTKSEEMLSLTNKLYKIALDNEELNFEKDSASTERRIAYLIRTANLFNKFNKIEKVKLSLEKAVESAKTILIDSYKYKQLKNIAGAYASYNMIDKAEAIAKDIPYTNERRLTYKEISKNVLSYDAFPDIEGISVDTDNDGKPDFYDNEANISNITLEMDDDVDNDSILDTDDTTPFYMNNEE